MLQHHPLLFQTVQVVKKYLGMQSDIENKTILPEASVHEAMYFAATENLLTASENTYLHEQILTPLKSPKSPT